MNIQFIRDRLALRWLSQAAISETQAFLVVDAAAEALAAQDPDLDFDHVEPACMFGRVVELETQQGAPCLGGRERLIKRACRVRGEIVHHDADFLGFGEVNIADIHACIRRSPRLRADP